MTRKVLLDANMIISAFERKDPQAKQVLRQLLADDNTAFAITPLIRYEVLRGINFSNSTKYSELESILNGFEEFEICREQASLSSNLFRFSRSDASQDQSRIVDKRSFDLIHLATAKCNELELCSSDGDLAKLEKLYQDYLASFNH